jgi:hypothetical protein
MLATYFLVTPRLRMSGDKPPQPLYAFMTSTGTTLLLPSLYLALLIVQFVPSRAFILIGPSPE